MDDEGSGKVPRLSLDSGPNGWSLTKTLSDQTDDPKGAVTERLLGSHHSEFPSIGGVSARRGVPRELSEREFRRKTLSVTSKVWSERLGSMHTPRNPRPLPHTLGDPIESTVKTPDHGFFRFPRWPPAQSNGVWRASVLPGSCLDRATTGPWYTMMLHAQSPRGFPAPGGGPLQHPKRPAFPKSPRAARPFTHASVEKAQGLLELAMRCWQELRMPRRAEEAFEASITADPDNSRALAQYGRFKQEHLDPLRAEQLFARALFLEPGNRTALAGAAELAEFRGDSDAAAALFQRACAADPGNADLRAHFGFFAKETLRDAYRARSLLSDAIRLGPPRPCLIRHLLCMEPGAALPRARARRCPPLPADTAAGSGGEWSPLPAAAAKAAGSQRVSLPA